MFFSVGFRWDPTGCYFWFDSCETGAGIALMEKDRKVHHLDQKSLRYILYCTKQWLDVVGSEEEGVTSIWIGLLPCPSASSELFNRPGWGSDKSRRERHGLLQLGLGVGGFGGVNWCHLDLTNIDSQRG